MATENKLITLNNLETFKTLLDAQVGDIKFTTRTDLGDKWLLCNGDSVSRHDYSELAEMFPALEQDWNNYLTSSSEYTPNIFYCITYANGYWVAVGGTNDSSTYYARIAYTTDPTGNWTIKNLWSSSSSASCNTITYANGYWVTGGLYKFASDHYARIAYTTNLTGEWTIKDLWFYNNINNSISCVTYANGYWVAGGSGYDGSKSYARIAYTTNLTGNWTIKDLCFANNSYANYIKSITYANGYWVAGGLYYNGTQYATIAYTTNLTGEWTTKNLWSNNPSSDIESIIYANGYWVACGTYYNDDSYYSRIAYTTDPTGNWTIKNLWSYAYNKGHLYCITYANGYWIAGGHYNDKARMFYTTNLTGKWTTKDLWTSTSTINRGGINCITYANNYLVTGGSHKNNNNIYGILSYTDTSYLKLPTISSDKSYAYIKAKE